MAQTQAGKEPLSSVSARIASQAGELVLLSSDALNSNAFHVLHETDCLWLLLLLFLVALLIEKLSGTAILLPLFSLRRKILAQSIAYCLNTW